MLVRLFGSNYRVFRDGFDLSMEAALLTNEADQDRGYFTVDIEAEDSPLRLLRLAAIYGPNGSGKSSIVHAARALHYLATRSGPQSQEGEEIPVYAPFLLDSATRAEPCELGCEVVVGHRVLEYQIAFSRTKIIREKVIEKGRTKDRELISRDSEGGVTVDQKALSSEYPLAMDLSDVTRDNASVISVAAQLKQRGFTGLFRALDESLRTLLNDTDAMSYSLSQLHQDRSFREWSMHRLLIPADIGISDCYIEERQMPDSVFEEMKSTLGGLLDNVDVDSFRRQLEAQFAHTGRDGEYKIDLSDESRGTQKLLALAGPWYDVVRKGLTVFVDELSASLHPSLLMALLDALNTSPSSQSSQLIFTAHDPSPLEILRRDQVYFTEKDREGVARLIPLSDFGDRSVHNVRKRYLEGRYGGLPRIPGFESLFDE